MDEDGLPERDPARSATASLRRFGLLSVPILLVLFTLYWFAFRTSYEPILSGIAPDQAAEIVKVLDSKKIDYRLADAGATILVASAQANKARLELVGSDLPVRGQIGFELFNQSDMGLTEFAQKINYQRALQGELARTIMLLDGIQSVRVHLGLPEQRLFRAERSRPKASVTLILKPGTTLTESRVTGIQRMVAGAIPEMSTDAVAVLDGTGKVISSEALAQSSEPGSSDAIVADYRRRVEAAIAGHQPSLSFSANISLRMRPAINQVEAADAQSARAGKAPRGDPDYAVIVRITTREALDDGLRLDLIHAVQAAVDFDASRGDELAFIVGDVLPQAGPTLTQLGADRVVSRTTPPPGEAPTLFTVMPWLLLAIGLLLAGVLAVVLWPTMRRRQSPGSEELKSFAELLDRRLAEDGGNA